MTVRSGTVYECRVFVSPESLAEVSEWLGASAAERGSALRELLDLYGRVAENRPPRRRRERARFPRFSSAQGTGRA